MNLSDSALSRARRRALLGFAAFGVALLCIGLGAEQRAAALSTVTTLAYLGFVTGPALIHIR